MDIALALQVTDALEDLKLDADIKRLGIGLRVVEPSAEIMKIRSTTVRAKLTRAMHLIIQLDCILKNN
jgi:hypothetical protein